MTAAASSITAVMTSLFDCEIWHRRAAISAIKRGWRGVARFHECMSKRAYEVLCHLEKFLADNYADTDVPRQLGQSAGYAFTDLPQHLNKWSNKAEKVIATLKEAVAALIVEQHYVLSDEMMCCLKHAENEALYVRILTENLTAGEFKAHHVLRICEKLHKYFEHEYDGGRIDFTIE
jgi:hypothetical protein